MRAELLGYDVRRYQLAAFVIGGVLGGLAASSTCRGGSYITPASIGLPAAALPVIWVAVGGRTAI